MGSNSERIASSDCKIRLFSCEAHHVGGFTKEDRDGCEGEVGEDTSG
jgi:hypothetical protein